VREISENKIESSLKRVINTHNQRDHDEEWKLEALIEYITGTLLDVEDISIVDSTGKEPEERLDRVMEKDRARYDDKGEELSPEQMSEFEKVIVLRTVDTKWMDHIDQMDQLRQGIHLGAYGQNDPLQEYQMEGFAMFEEMVENIEDEVAKYIRSEE